MPAVLPHLQGQTSFWLLTGTILCIRYYCFIPLLFHFSVLNGIPESSVSPHLTAGCAPRRNTLGGEGRTRDEENTHEERNNMLVLYLSRAAGPPLITMTIIAAEIKHGGEIGRSLDRRQLMNHARGMFSQ